MKNSGLFFSSKQCRMAADEVLNHPQQQNRLTLILASLVAMGMSLAIPVILDCLGLASAVLGGNIRFWLDLVYMVLVVGSCLFVTLPLCAGVYRMAVCMVTQGDDLNPRTLMPEQVNLSEVLYPFTSGRAYLRCMSAGLQILWRWGGIVLLPWLFLYISDIGLAHVKEIMIAPIFVTVLQWVVALVLGIFWWLLWCGHFGYAYLVFVYPNVSLKACRKRYKAQRKQRSWWSCLKSTVIHAGVVILSLLLVFIPLLLHTLPLMMLQSAVYGRWVCATEEEAQ